MAEEPPAEGARHRPAIDFQAGYGAFHISIKIDNPWLAAGLGAGILTLGAFYISNRESVEAAVKIALADLPGRILNITPSSILVKFVCDTEEKFLAFMKAFATGTLKQRLQKEFSKIGFKYKLEVTITVYDPESEMRRELMTVAAGAPSVKVGKPTKAELHSLAYAIADIWRKLGHCLGVPEAVLDDIDQDSDFEADKGYDLLMYWKRDATASYKVLNDALRHEDVQRQVLAEKFFQG